MLGAPGATATVVEFGDLQCPVCKDYSEQVDPEADLGTGAPGQARFEFRQLPIIGPRLSEAGAAAIAAGEQGRCWNYIELFYRNQGVENSGYADDDVPGGGRPGAGVPDIAEWNRARQSSAARQELKRTSKQAVSFGFNGTPSFLVTGPNGTRKLGTPGLSVAPFEAAISQVG